MYILSIIPMRIQKLLQQPGWLPVFAPKCRGRIAVILCSWVMLQLFYSGQYWAPKILCKCYSGVFGNTFVGTKYLSSYRCVSDNSTCAKFGDYPYAIWQLEWHTSSYSVRHLFHSGEQCRCATASSEQGFRTYSHHPMSSLSTGLPIAHRLFRGEIPKWVSFNFEYIIEHLLCRSLMWEFSIQVTCV